MQVFRRFRNWLECTPNRTTGIADRWKQRRELDALLSEMRNDLAWDEDYVTGKATTHPFSKNVDNPPHEPSYVDRLSGYEVE